MFVIIHSFIIARFEEIEGNTKYMQNRERWNIRSNLFILSVKNKNESSMKHNRRICDETVFRSHTELIR